MGMHIGLIAAKGTVAEMVRAFPDVWPKFEIVTTKNGFANEDEIWSWKESNERFVSAAEWTKADPGQEVYVLCQSGEWTVLIDFSYVLAADENALKQLSEKFGSVLSFVVQTTSGCAFFWNYESGQIVRSIQNADGELTVFGEELPQEAGIDVRNYYMDETEQLMNAFGLSKVEQLLIPSTAVAIATADRTDYSELLNVHSENTEAQAMPWWKFW